MTTPSKPPQAVFEVTVEDFAAFLNEKTKGAKPCPTCDANLWALYAGNSAISDKVMQPVEVAGVKPAPAGFASPSTAMFLIICTNCGHTTWFNSGPMMMWMAEKKSGQEGGA